MKCSNLFGPFSDTLPPVGAPGWELTVFLTRDWYNYAIGYVQAAGVLIEQLDEHNPHLEQDTAVFPILFCYRHYAELMLKNLLHGANFALGDPPPTEFTHDLPSCQRKVREQLEQINMGDVTKEYATIERSMKEFAFHDPGSFSFRYPIDKKREPTSKDLCNVNLAHLYEAMHELHESFGAVVRELNTHITSRQMELDGPPDDWFWDSDHCPQTESEGTSKEHL